MRKSKFNLTHLHSTTLDPGYLVPFLLQPTLPNDTFRIGLSTFIRAQPMLAPLMHEVRLFTQYWFVPNRLLWEDWEEFITGGEDLLSTPPFPTIKLDADDAKVGSLTDYFGFPCVEGIEVSALPYRAMAMIWNERYRDEDLQQMVPIDIGSGEDTNTSRKLLSPSFAKDYFTTARPFTQRGGDVLVPVSTTQQGQTTSGLSITFKVGVLYGNSTSNTTVTGLFLSESELNDAVSAFLTQAVNNGTLDALMADPIPAAGIFSVPIEELNRHTALTKSIDTKTSTSATINVQIKVLVYPIASVVVNSELTPGVSVNPFAPSTNNGNLFKAGYLPLPASGNFWSTPTGFFNGDRAKGINLSNGDITPVGSGGGVFVDNPIGTFNIVSTAQVAGFTIRDLRMSSALQRYAERSLKWGNRYEEFIMREFGIKPRDARIQRPEYLGGGRGVLNISEVLQTAESADTGVGTMRGHGVASISQRPIRFRCPEHGIILGLLSIRPKSVYTQGIDREWLKRSRLDFFTPELASVGMQEVLQQELYAQPDNFGKVFAYSERYQEYRYHKPVVTGEFRDNLSFWNMARVFQNAPELTPEFIDMAYSAPDFKRPFQIQDNGAHSFVVMLKNHIRAYRPIPKRAKDVLR